MSSKNLTDNIIIRHSTPNDIPDILNMIKGLAEYEKLADEVRATENNLEKYIFGKEKFVDAWLAEFNNEIAGHVIFFHNFSTFLSKPGLYIEELYVKPEFRNKGIGKKLLMKVIEIAKADNCGRVEWAVLDWNKPAIEFYKSMKALAMDEWTVFRLTEDNFGQFKGN